MAEMKVTGNNCALILVPTLLVFFTNKILVPGIQTEPAKQVQRYASGILLPISLWLFRNLALWPK
jgi:hypothetical protein